MNASPTQSNAPRESTAPEGSGAAAPPERIATAQAPDATPELLPSELYSVVITGAASGIGRALALSFARQGSGLLLTDRDAPGLEATARACETAGGRVLDSTALDITDADAVSAWARDTCTRHGLPDEVHHVAGIAIWGDARSMPHEKWQRVIDINLMGSVHMVEAFVPLLADAPARRGDGAQSAQPRRRWARKTRNRRKLVFVSSAAGIIGLPWHAAYSASKGGVLGMCEVLRFDLAPRGIDVHVVAPGAVDTPLVQSIDIHGVDQTAPRVVRAKRLFQGHAVTPEQAAQLIRRGVSRGKYLILTGGDIAVARWAQVNAPWAYRGAMRALNRAFRWAAGE